MLMRRWLWPLGIAVVLLFGTALFSILTNVEPSSRMAVRFPDLQGDVSRHPLLGKTWANATTSKAPTAIWLVRDGQQWLAFSNQTPHPLGCEAIWDAKSKQFVEPCLGQIFDRDGVNVAGPAPRGLDQYPVRVTEHGSVEIDLAKPTPAKR